MANNRRLPADGRWPAGFDSAKKPLAHEKVRYSRCSLPSFFFKRSKEGTDRTMLRQIYRGSGMDSDNHAIHTQAAAEGVHQREAWLEHIRVHPINGARSTLSAGVIQFRSSQHGQQRLRSVTVFRAQHGCVIGSEIAPHLAWSQGGVHHRSRIGTVAQAQSVTKL